MIKALELLGVLVAIVIAAMTGGYPGHVTVAVTNVSTVPLRAVNVHVAGRSYRIGDIAPGGSRAIDIVPQGQSCIELTSLNGSRLQVHCNVGPEDAGSLATEVTPTRIVAMRDLVRRPGM